MTDDIIEALRRAADWCDPDLLLDSYVPAEQLRADAQTLRDLADEIEKAQRFAAEGGYATVVIPVPAEMRALAALREDR